jgi:hypothetical protein
MASPLKVAEKCEDISFNLAELIDEIDDDLSLLENKRVVMELDELYEVVKDAHTKLRNWTGSEE